MNMLRMHDASRMYNAWVVIAIGYCVEFISKCVLLVNFNSWHEVT